MTQTRKELERQRRRELLLEAAARVFGRRPFDEATMQEVAAEAQIGMQGLYEHFPSKQELYEQVMLQRAIAYQAKAEEVLRQPGPPLERIRALATAFVRQFLDQPWRLPSFSRDRVYFDWALDSRFSPRLREVYEAERAHLRGLIVQALADGALRPFDPDFLAQLCMDTLHASLHYGHHRGQGEDAEACVARALDCLFHGVATRP